jgi:hypothetical protein
MKSIFNLVFSLVLIVVFSYLVACQHDDTTRDLESTSIQNTRLVIRMESSDHLRYANPIVFRKLIKTSQYAKTLAVAKDGITNSPFALNLSTIQIIERNTYTQYTMPVVGHAAQDLYLINYMLIEFDDGASYQFLIKYPRLDNDQVGGLDYTNAFMEAIHGETLLYKSGIGGLRPCLDGVPELVSTIQQYTCETTRCTGGDRHEWGDDCPCANLSYCTMPTRTCEWETVNVWSCTGGGAVGSNGNNGPAGGGGNDPNQDDPIETVPVLADWEAIENCMNTSSFNENINLTPEMITWLQANNSQVAGAINAMLQEYGCDAQAQEDIFDEISGMMESDSAPRNAMEDNYSIEDLNHDCTRRVVALEILTNLKTNLTRIIDRGIGSETNVTLDFKNLDIDNPNLNAVTQMDNQESIDNGDYNIFIVFSNNYLSGNPTKLSIAAITIHEIIHAQLIYLYLKGELLIEYPQYTDLKTKFDAYIANRNMITAGELEDAMHLVMVDFIGTMAYTLFKYANDNGMENITHQYCKDVTKGIFYGTPAMNIITPDVNLQNDYILKAQNEQNNTSDAKGKDC